MKRLMLPALSLLLAASVLLPHASAAPITVGYISYDLTTPPGEAQFDIVNQSGINSTPFPDSTFPVTTSLSLSNLSLDVSFASGPDEIFGPAYFTLGPDGISFDGTPLSTGIAQPTGLSGAIMATLTGNFSATTITLNDGSVVTIDPTFTAILSDPSGLSDGDFGLIDANPAGTSPVVPEPSDLTLVGTGFAGLAWIRRRRVFTLLRGAMAGKWLRLGALPLLLVCASFGARTASATAVGTTHIRLNAWTTPGSGATGSTSVNITATGFPAGTIPAGLMSISLSTSCGGPAAATTTPSAVRPIVGTSDRITFQIPGTLATGTYYISVSGSLSGGGTYSSSNCSEVTATHTSTSLAACLPSSSLAVSTGTTVTSYVPHGYWEGSSTGISVVPIEGAGTPAVIPTSSIVNSCSSNSQTGQTVCVANNTDVYEITGSALTATLNSGSSGTAGFSGGSCMNCGVAVDALTNTAVINMGISGSPSGSGVELLNLSTNSFSPVFPTNSEVSENISVDPNRNLILSPGESGNYDLLKITPSGGLVEYQNYIDGGGEFDSAAEDCTTGIALSTQEFSGNLYITDLTQAVFTAPSGGSTSGTWTAPGQIVNFPEFGGFSAGTSGISVAAGSTHLGIVTGEFGGNSFGAFQLPATSGTGTPSFVDYVQAYMPGTPDGYGFSSGYDPHTITAYTSPNNGKAYGLNVSWATGQPSYIGVVDLQALLNAPRTPGTHSVDPSVDLVATGVITYIPVP
jgi:hypothetical protein